ncbi:MAG: MATE family efflux transporter [Spirochaetaceae bacterium]|jgi:putative MATE family efflux protein|nr:MATE family efflux transporter [Spirochaetaceae bacterium]
MLMTEWNNKTVRALLWPLIVEQLLAVTIGIVDTVMVSSAGEAAVSGVSLVDQINQLLIIIFTALATGGSVVASQYIGRKDSKNCAASSKQMMLANTVLSVFLMVVTLIFYKYILYAAYGKMEDEVTQNARVYFRITSLSFPFFALYTSSASLFRAMGNSRIPMFTAVFMNVINIIFNWIFIIVLKTGVAGAAASTLICRIAGCVLIFILQCKDKYAPIYPENIHKTKLDALAIKKILRIGVPAAVESSLFQFGKILLARLVTDFGTAAIAANAVTGAIASFVYMPGTGFGMAILTITGQCLGAKDYEGAKLWTFRLIRLTYIVIVSLNIMNLLCMDMWLKLFNLQSETVALTQKYLTLHCITSSIAWPLSFALPNALRAAGDVKFVMISAVCTMWFVRISSSYLCAYVFGFEGLSVWIGMGLDFFFRAVIFTTRWKRGKWRSKNVI